MLHPFAALLAASALWAAPARAQPWEATVLGHVVLPEVEIDGLKVSELSGLRWSAAEGLLYAVSDKAHLVTFRPVLPPEGPLALEAVAARPLLGRNGWELDGDDFNPEALELAGSQPPELLLVSEAGPAAAVFDTEGAWLRDVDLPVPVTDPGGQRSGNNGLESVALHPVHGLLVALEEPHATDPRELHTIFAQDGRAFSFDTSELGETGRTSVKDIAVLPDGSILILERERLQDDARLTPYLRRLDPAACPTRGPCPTSVARMDLPGISDADFEGLAPLGDGRVLLVSDDEVDDERRSVFAMVRLPGS